VQRHGSILAGAVLSRVRALGQADARKTKNKDCTACAGGMPPNSGRLWSEKEKREWEERELERIRREAEAKKEWEQREAKFRDQRAAFDQAYEEYRVRCTRCAGKGTIVTLRPSKKTYTKTYPPRRVNVSMSSSSPCFACAGNGFSTRHRSKLTGEDVKVQPPEPPEPPRLRPWTNPKAK
jgi:hypothetical protein